MLFDGTAAAILHREGVSALRSRSRGVDSPKLRLHDDDSEKLDRISLAHHGSVSKDRYFACARSKQAQATAVSAKIRELELARPSKRNAAKLDDLRDTLRTLNSEAETVRKLAYARRSGVVQLLARAVPKKRRDIVLWTMATGGFAINVLWVPYLIHIYKKMATDLEQSQNLR